MRREIARLSLFVLCLATPALNAAPWRETNPLKSLTNLPTRLIDSIMAQGNWNILFQEGPFREFQRQMAISNHFAMRGGAEQAELQYQKAGDVLDIAYASLRGRFSWPRDAATINAADLPWGENRDTFQDYLLCRLQLFVEKGLARHERNILQLDGFDNFLQQTETQLGTTVRNKDGDLAAFVDFLREIRKLRENKNLHPSLLAEKFSALSDNSPTSTRNYWSRRFLLARIVESLNYGNLAYAAALAEYYFNQQRKYADKLAFARLFIQAGAFATAQTILEESLAGNDLKAPESYSDFASYSDLYQNLLLWLENRDAAAVNAQNTQQHFDELLQTGKIAREDLVDFNAQRAHSNLFAAQLAWRTAKICPKTENFSPSEDLDVMQQIRERIFYEHCGLKRDAAWWHTASLAIKENSEARALLRFYLHSDKIFVLPKATTNEKPTALSEYFSARTVLAAELSKKRPAKLAEKLQIFLRAENQTLQSTVFFKWGISLSDNLISRALKQIESEKNAKVIGNIFTQLNFRYAVRLYRKTHVPFFAPMDGAAMRAFVSRNLLGLDLSIESSFATPNFTAKVLTYSDENFVAVFDPAERKRPLRYYENHSQDIALKSTKSIVYFGESWASIGRTLGGEIAPLLSFCAECTTSSERNPRRLLMATGETKPWQQLTSELSDDFSSVPEPSTYAECSIASRAYIDTVILPVGSAIDKLPCNTLPEKIIIEDNTQIAPSAYLATLALASRPGSALIIVPKTLTPQARTAFLFDFFQRTNRRQTRPSEAFREAKQRGEKSFADDAAFANMQYYESMR